MAVDFSVSLRPGPESSLRPALPPQFKFKFIPAPSRLTPGCVSLTRAFSVYSGLFWSQPLTGQTRGCTATGLAQGAGPHYRGLRLGGGREGGEWKDTTRSRTEAKQEAALAQWRGHGACCLSVHPEPPAASLWPSES